MIYQDILKFSLKKLKGKRIKYFTVDFLTGLLDNLRQTFLKYRTKGSILFIDFRMILIQINVGNYLILI